MSSPRSSKLLIIGGVTVAVAAGAWFGAHHFATKRAETELVQLLDRQNMRDQVRWTSISATPMGKVTLEGVTLTAPGSPPVQVAQIKVADIIDEPTHKRGQLIMNGIADPNGVSLLGDTDAMRAVTSDPLPPANMEISWDFNQKKDTGSLALTLLQPNAMEASLNLQMDRVAPLFLLAQQADPNALGNMNNALGALSQVGEVRVSKLDANVRDHGVVARSIAEQQGNSTPGQQAASFDAQVQQYRAQCLSEPALAELVSRDKACDALHAFITGKSKTLSLRLRPEQPQSLNSTVQRALMGNPAQAIGDLKVEIGS